MARGSAAANTAATSAQGLANTYSGNASALFGPLSSMLVSQAANPQGINPTDQAAMNTNAMQSAGGSQAAAVGAGRLRAARTRNAGGSDAAIGEAGRAAARIAPEAALQTRLKDASLKSSERGQALGGLNNLFAENLSGGNQALGIVPQAIQANTAAENASWDWSKDLFAPIL